MGHPHNHVDLPHRAPLLGFNLDRATGDYDYRIRMRMSCPADRFTAIRFRASGHGACVNNHDIALGLADFDTVGFSGK